MADEEPSNGIKRELDEAGGAPDSPSKKIKTDNDSGSGEEGGDGGDDKNDHTFVPPGTVGVTTINDNDVLSGRGGGTNLHPGNRQFRDLINLYRRDYLKARKNDKPAISRSIVNAIREKNGRFLKKIEKTGLWFEIGDDAAREKTSQALRQRAPEMRKLLLDHEMEGARQQQQMMMGMPGVPPMMMPGMNMPMMMAPNGQMPFNPAMMGMPNPAMFNPSMMGMQPMQFNHQGMPQQPGAPGMPNEGGDGSGEGGDEGGNSNNNDGGNLNDNNNNNNNNNNDGAPQGQMNNPMMMNMMQMNPMGMNMGQMGQMSPNMVGAPAPESHAQVQQ